MSATNLDGEDLITVQSSNCGEAWQTLGTQHNMVQEQHDTNITETIYWHINRTNTTFSTPHTANRQEMASLSYGKQSEVCTALQTQAETSQREYQEILEGAIPWNCLSLKLQ